MTCRHPCRHRAALHYARACAAHEKKVAELQEALDKGTFGVSWGGPWFLSTYNHGVLDSLTRYGVVKPTTKMSGNAQVGGGTPVRADSVPACLSALPL